MMMMMMFEWVQDRLGLRMDLPLAHCPDYFRKIASRLDRRNR